MEHQLPSKQNKEEITVAPYKVSAAPLDFSFLKITNVEALRKEQCRPGGNRRPVVESDDEEEKKVRFKS